MGHPLIRPKSIHNEELLAAYGDDYLYLACVKFVKSVSNMKEMLGLKHVLCWLLSQHSTCLLSHMRAWDVVHMVVEKDTALW